MITINVDRNASVKDYQHLPERAVLLTSHFHTIQGEGPMTGRPALFIRTAGCNIGLKEDCPWCDTQFALDKGVVTPFDALHDELKKVAKWGTFLAVITGGEPLLQRERLLHFIDEHHQRHNDEVDFQFETNGHRLRGLRNRPRVHYVISPKIPHGHATYLPLRQEWLAEDTSLKYVVTADKTSPYHELPHNDIETAVNTGVEVYVSGMTVYRRAVQPGEVANVWDRSLVDQEATAANYHRAATLCRMYGYRLSLQTHLFGAVE